MGITSVSYGGLQPANQTSCEWQNEDGREKREGERERERERRERGGEREIYVTKSSYDEMM